MRLSEEAGWNQTRGDWQLLLSLACDTSFAATDGENVVGTVTAVCYGDHAWIGMMLVGAAFRRQGIGIALMRHVLARLPPHAIVGLDATPEGRPMYLKLGFNDVHPLVRMVRQAGTPPIDETTASSRVQVATACDFDAVAELDLSATGLAREALISGLMLRNRDGAWIVRDGDEVSGFCLARSGRRYRYIGPTAAPDIDSARGLLAGAIAADVTRASVLDVDYRQAALIEWLEAQGFAVVRRLTRMVLGDSRLPAVPDGVTTICGPEWG